MYKKNKFLFLMLFYLITINCKKIRDKKKSNVLLILADDGGFEMGAYRNKICQTPYLDNLAKKSLIFNNAYTSVSSCSPSRSAILTGMPSHQNGMYGLHQGQHHFNSFNDIASLPKILGKNKIRTGIIGKKHVGPKSVFNFDYERTEEQYPILQVGRNITLIKNLVKEFLNGNNNNDTKSQRQFFLFVSFHDPHRCGHTTPEYGEFCEKFGNGEPGMGSIPDWQPILYQPEEVQLPYFLPDTLTARQEVAAQYTTISRLDQGVGLILKELNDSGRSDDTLIIYTSDNGIPFPNGRTNLYDSGLAEPLLISSPLHKQRHNQVTYSLTSLLDIVPTLFDWYGLKQKTKKFNLKLTGRSLIPLLAEEPKNTSSEIIFASHNLHEITMYYPMRAIRSHKFKLIHNLNYYAPFPIDQDLYLSATFQDILNKTKIKEPLKWYKTLFQYYQRPEWELYDLHRDPAEVNNLFGNAVFEKDFEQLKEKLTTWLNETYDPWLCSPHSVYENKGYYLHNPSCMSLYNFIDLKKTSTSR